MTVGPSPRVEYREKGGVWRESHPKPAHLSVGRMAARMFGNHQRNTQLYTVALAERLVAAPSDHSRDELMRLVSEAHRVPAQLQFRLVFVMREGEELISEAIYKSELFAAEDFL
ncbi:hypothetical protein [Cognatishimia activa]|uniref:Uncharacterized protein n=1 Tax=Cognatishimia activa TaxID=1715691 RepID=A0A975EMD4_9RHOB|nr:hypothetical protein [Cognatishimia activa]QTN34710.1 hypothetical protein HZ995_09335 [Cognatishimia activa]